MLPAMANVSPLLLTVMSRLLFNITTTWEVMLCPLPDTLIAASLAPLSNVNVPASRAWW